MFSIILRYFAELYFYFSKNCAILQNYRTFVPTMISTMDIYSKSDSAILQDIGKKIKEVRVEQNITQTQLSENSGVSVRRIISIENGENHSIMGTIAVLRALSMLDYFERFFEEKKITPLEYAKILKTRKVRTKARSNKIKENKDEVEW